MVTRSSFSFAPVLLGVAALAITGTSAVRAADENLDAATKARIERFEKGPSTIDVSKYPEAAQEAYAIFARKCSQCHKLSRPINSDYALPDEWSRYIKRMMHKPGSGIGRGEAKKIYQFLVYDSSVRKKSMLDQKLDKLSPSEKSQTEAKIEEVHKAYDQN